jgi:hypothetical protein
MRTCGLSSGTGISIRLRLYYSRYVSEILKRIGLKENRTICMGADASLFSAAPRDSASIREVGMGFDQGSEEVLIGPVPSS